MGTPGLSSLPVELVEEILRYLEEDDEPATDGVSWYALPRTSRAGWQNAHNPFRNLILGYPRTAPIVEPFLYRDIAIWTERRLVNLMLRILQDPSRGSLIRHLRCEFDVSELADGGHDSPLLGLDLEMLDNILKAAWCSGPELNVAHPIIDDVERSGYSEMLEDLVNPFDGCSHQRGEIWAKVLAIILCHAPNVESAVARIAGRDAEYQDHSLTDLMNRRARPPLFAGRPWPPENPHFQTLTALTVKPNRRWGPVDTSTLQVVFSLPNLGRLEVHDDDGVWPYLCPPSIFVECPKLEELLLYHSRIREGSLAALCARLPNLKVLLVHFSMWFQHDQIPLPHISLNDAVLRLAPSLRSLTLLRRNPGHFIESLPKRLTCLGRLRNLEHLAVDFKGLFGPVTIGAWPTVRLEDMLPTSLTKLEVIADWSNQLHEMHGVGRWYWNLLRTETRQVAQLRIGVSGLRFSKLRYFCISIPHDESPPYGVEDSDIIWKTLDTEWFEDWETC